LVSLDDEEESDEARGGPTERGKKRKPPRNAVEGLGPGKESREKKRDRKMEGKKGAS